MALVGRQVQAVDALSRADIEGRGRPVGIAVFEPRLLRIVVVGVVEAQVEAECRGVAQREVVQRPVARFLRERADVASRRTGESIGVRRERGGVGGAHPAPLFRSILGSGAELVAPPLGGHPFILPDVVLPSLEGVQRAQVVTRQLLAPGGRIGDIGRPFGRREDEVAAGIVGVVIAVRVVGMELTREGRLVTAAQHDVDRGPADVVLRRRAEHHLGLLDPIDGGRAQQRGQLLGGHRRGAPVQDHRHRRGPGQRQRTLLLHDARQAGQGFVGVIDGLALGQPAEVVVEPSLLDLHDGAFALDHHGRDLRRGLREADVTQVRAVRFDGADLVGDVLELQPVGPHRRTDLEAPVSIRSDGVEVDRVAVEQYDGGSRDGRIRRIDDPPADHGIGGSLRRGGSLGFCGGEAQEDRHRNQQKLQMV